MKDDLIRREDALDILDGLQIAHEQGECGAYAEHREQMSNLPSIRPEFKPCDDCQEFSCFGCKWQKEKSDG